MRKRLSVLLLFAAMISGVVAFAHASPGNPMIDPIVSIAPAQPTPSAPATTLRIDGTIEKYDASAGLLSLLTSSGKVQVPLASTARIRQGWHRIDAPTLERLAGHRAAIRYSETDGVKRVESIHVFGKDERVER